MNETELVGSLGDSLLKNLVTTAKQWLVEKLLTRKISFPGRRGAKAKEV